MRPPLMQFLWQRYRELISPAATLATEPLLNSATLDQLRLRAQSAMRPPIAFQLTSAHQLIGEQLSYYRGRGLEFEENRKYQTGDEPRLINWRLYARTGEFYSKVFNEERRPEVYLVADGERVARGASASAHPGPVAHPGKDGPGGFCDLE